MLKPVRIGIALWLLMGVNQLIYAGAGSLFDVTATGAASTVSIRLCLNGKGALSCQDETVSALTLTISPSIRNHVYPAMGIKINTPGYGISGLGLTCTPNSNGYCLFSASQSQPKTVTLVSAGKGTQATLVATATPSTILNGGSSILGSRGGSGTGAVTYAVTTGLTNCSISNTILTGLNLGSCTVVATKAADSNYEATTSAPITVTITAEETIHVLAVGSNTDVPGIIIAPLSDISLNNGVTWTASTTQPPAGSGGLLISVACSNGGDICTALGSTNSGNNPLSYTSTDGGATWVASVTQPPSAPSGFGTVYGVACSRVGTTCAAVGIDSLHGTPFSWTSADGGIHWAASTTPPPTNGFVQGVLNGIACSSDGRVCTTVGNYRYDENDVPLSYTSSDGGVTWVVSTTPPPVNGSEIGRLLSVACSSNGLVCTTVGYDGNSVPLSYTSSDGGVTWVASMTQPPVNGSGMGQLPGVACSSNGLTCTAVGQDGNTAPLSYISSDGGVTWVASTTQPPVNSAGSGVLLGVACSSNGLTCTAVGQDGNYLPLSYTTLDGGDTWVASTTQPPLDSISNVGNLGGVTRSN